MKRGTPDDRRWENGLRQVARSSDVSESSKPSIVHRGTKLRRPQSENHLAATAALQAYLSNDIDARSRIRCPRSVAGSVGKEVERAILEPKTKRTEVKCHEHENPTQTRVPIPVDTALNPSSAFSRDAASQPESPLSRFQKHRKQSGVNREKIRYPLVRLTKAFDPSALQGAQSPHYIATQRRDVSTHPLKTGPSETLTRSLMDKIQEAKRLRHSEAVHDQQTKKRHDMGTQSSVAYALPGRRRTSPVTITEVQPKSSGLPSPTKPCLGASPIVVSTRSPPIPHAKPIMPVIPISPSTPPALNLPGESQQEGGFKVEPDSEKMPSSVDKVIEVTNAVLLIQRMWRRSRLIVQRCRRNELDGHECNRQEPVQVTLVVDKNCGKEAVTPLFAAVKMKNREVSQPQLQENQLSHLFDQSDATLHALVSSENEDGVSTTHEGYPEDIPSRHTSHPWTDHELVFLEEGRRIGELQDSVLKGFSMDEDELIWKRPQQIIQRLEAARVTTLQKTRRKRQTSRPLEYLTGHDVDMPQCIADNVPETTRNSTQDVLVQCRGKHAATSARKQKMPRVSLLKRRGRNKVVICPAKRAFKMRAIFVRVQRAKCSRRGHSKADSSSTSTEDGKAWRASTPEFQVVRTGNQSDCAPRSPLPSSAIDELEQPADNKLFGSGEAESHSSSGIQDQFVVFSGFGEASSALDTGCSRNDLISVGDLALARSLLCDRHHDQSASNLGEQSGGFIPLTLPTPSPLSTTNRVEVWDEPSTEPTQLATSCSGEHVTDNQAGHIDGCATGSYMKKCCRSSAVQPFDRFDEEPEVLTHRESLWAWDDFLPRREGHCNDGSLQRFEVAKSAVSETVARTRDEQEAPSSPRAAPVVVGPQLNEAKRLEFLRALDDFKRCLRPASSPSSLLSGA